MRALLVVVVLSSPLAAVLAFAGPAGSAAKPPTTSLLVTFWSDGDRPGTRVVWRLRCLPTRGTHPARAAACRTLDRVGRAPFAPVPSDEACAEIYGGPQVATVSGLLAGKKVWAHFTRRDGCQIYRWDRLRPLLPPGGLLR